MSQITDLSVQKRNKDRVNIELDGEYAFSLYLETAVKYGLKKGKDLSNEEIQTYKKEDGRKYAFEAALNYLSYKARTTKEMVDYLKKKEMDEESIGYAIEKLEEYKYLNDEQYAEDYVKYYQSNPRYGAKMLEYRLIQKGISASIAKRVCETFREDEEGRVIIELIRKARKKYAGLEPIKQRDKIYRLLISKGFDYDKIKSIWRKVLEEDIEE